MKSSGMSFLLWCAWLFGFGGIHRIYLGKYFSGILYLLTWGGLGIGQIIDLFLIPRMVERENMMWQLQHGATVNISLEGVVGNDTFPRHTSAKKTPPALDLKKLQEAQILQLARRFHGRLTPVELASNSNLSLEESDKALEELVRKGHAEMDVTDSGSIVYEFSGFLDFHASES
ncbi:MAG: TM2 domain-containing protein [bacterium]|nr:TM2 domain-containing protein [bacterium]